MIKLVYEFSIEEDVFRKMWQDDQDEYGDEVETSFEEYVENVAYDMSAFEADELACDSDVSVDFCN